MNFLFWGALFGGLSAPQVPSPRFRALVDTTSGARGDAYFRDRFPARYQPMPALSSYPAVVENDIGSGRSVYFASTVAEAYGEYHLPEHYELLTQSVAAGREPLVVTDAPGCVEVAVRYQSKVKWLMVHLINMTGEMTRPLVRILPVARIEMRLPGVRSVASVRRLSSGEAVSTRSEDGLVLSIENLEAYDTVVLERVNGV